MRQEILPFFITMSVISIILLIIAGVAAGFINTLSGAGSFLTLPLLMHLGLSSPVANGTNRLSILVQSLYASYSFRQRKLLDTKTALKLSIAIIPGALAGSLVAVQIPEIWLNKAIGILMLMFLSISIIFNKKIKSNTTIQSNNQIKPIHYFAFFIAGIYGGFVQAGFGIIALLLLVLGPGIDLVRANALKVFLTFIYTPLAIIIFAYNDQIEWIPAIILSIGNLIGTKIATLFAIRKGGKIIQIMLYIVLTGLSIKFLFHDWL